MDAVNNPIKPQTGETLDLIGKTITVDPTSVEHVYAPIHILGVSNVTILGGTIVGDRASRGIGSLGHGILIGQGATNIKLVGTTVQDCFGDGVLLVDATNVELDHVTLNHNCRQGLSTSFVNGLWIHNSRFTNNGGSAPGAGIDLEPDFAAETIQNVKIENNTFFGNQGAGVLIACPPLQRINIQVINNNFSGCPIDGTDGVVSWYAKWLNQIFHQYWYYPRSWST